MGLVGLEFYDPNPTRPAINRKKFVTQPNSLSPKNWPNLIGWIGSDRFWRIDCTPLSIIEKQTKMYRGIFVFLTLRWGVDELNQMVPKVHSWGRLHHCTPSSLWNFHPSIYSGASYSRNACSLEVILGMHALWKNFHRVDYSHVHR